MIKEVKTTEEVVKRYKYCDVCNASIPRGLACSVAQCSYCGKDLCEQCIGHEEPSLGDYRGEMWCQKCWDIGSEYRPEIKALRSKIESLYEKWESRCKEPKI